jgi:hypothetical protein
MSHHAAPGPSVSDLLNEYRLAWRYSLALIDGLGPDQVLWRPHELSSAIGWHLGHQAAVAHYMIRNLTAAEPSLDEAFDRLFDSANPEPDRGRLPPVDEILDYRTASVARVEANVSRIVAGDVGAPEQLLVIADGVLRAVINHEYQHDAWILEVRDTLTDDPAPVPYSTNVSKIDNYWVMT